MGRRGPKEANKEATRVIQPIMAGQNRESRDVRGKCSIHTYCSRIPTLICLPVLGALSFTCWRSNVKLPVGCRTSLGRISAVRILTRHELTKYLAIRVRTASSCLCKVSVQSYLSTPPPTTPCPPCSPLQITNDPPLLGHYLLWQAVWLVHRASSHFH